jgi:hypothetical protein
VTLWQALELMSLISVEPESMTVAAAINCHAFVINLIHAALTLGAFKAVLLGGVFHVADLHIGVKQH